MNLNLCERGSVVDIKKLVSAGLYCIVSALLSIPVYAANDSASVENMAEGRAIAFDVKRGNCLACHRIEGGRMAGDIAPPIMMMKMRYPNKADLRAQIWDATALNPDTIMPPFGRHGIISDSDIDKVTDFIYSL